MSKLIPLPSSVPKFSMLLCVLVLPALWLATGCDSAAPAAKKSVGEKVGSVRVKVDFNGRAESKEFDVPCSDASTAFSVLERGQNMGDLKFQSSGAGETAFVVAIDGVENEKAAGDNWTYRVNGKLGDKSSGVFSVQPGDEILWVFGKYSVE